MYIIHIFEYSKNGCKIRTTRKESRSWGYQQSISGMLNYQSLRLAGSATRKKNLVRKVGFVPKSKGHSQRCVHITFTYHGWINKVCTVRQRTNMIYVYITQ